MTLPVQRRDDRSKAQADGNGNDAARGRAAGTGRIGRIAEIIDGLPQSFSAAAPPSSLREICSVGGKVVNGPVAPGSSRCVWVVAEQDETARSRRRVAPTKRRRQVFAVAGEAPGNGFAIGKG